MKKLIIVRHGESVANANGIIQGNNNDYGLTETGKERTYLTVQNNLGAFSGASRIVASTAKRAIETAQIISDNLGNLPISTNKNIEEVDSGVLSGMNKAEASRDYPHYYNIWKNRQDLDEIPCAEKGNDLQARVIGFLMQYYNKPEFCDIVVSHAGFIRCLINTIEQRERTAQFGIENSGIFEISDVFGKMDIQRKDRAMSSKVFIVTVNNGKYVVKLKDGKISEQDYSEQALLNRLDGNNLPRILSMQNFEDNHFCKVIKYVNGKHIYGKLSDTEYDAVIDAEKALRRALEGVQDGNFRINNLEHKLKTIYSGSKNEYIKQMAKTLLDSKYASSLGDTHDYVLSHDDFNRDNILFELTEDGKVKANIIDFEALEFAPRDFQFASMLACGLLLEGEKMPKIIDTIRKSGKDVDKILYLMQIRILEGLYFFAEQPSQYTSGNRQASYGLLKRYFFSSELLQHQLDKFKSQDKENNKDEAIFCR